jgi:hypothetical protein
MYILLELSEGVCIRSLHTGTVSLWTCDLRIRAVIIPQTVRSGRVLRKELQLVENAGGDCCRLVSDL